jgi:hypothetical protein
MTIFPLNIEIRLESFSFYFFLILSKIVIRTKQVVN